jgi:hypothetical protein
MPKAAESRAPTGRASLSLTSQIHGGGDLSCRAGKRARDRMMERGRIHWNLNRYLGVLAGTSWPCATNPPALDL